MNQYFQPFQYQLNLNNTGQKTPGKIKRENKPKTISLLITPLTDIYAAAKKLCAENNLSENLVLILAASFFEEVEKQIQAQRNNQMDESLSSISFNSQQSKTFNSKTKFCESLQDSQVSNVSNQSTFNNAEFVTDPPIEGNSNEEQYSFRPAAYLKMLDLTDDDEENSSFSVNNLSVNQSYLTNESSQSKQAGKILVKKNFQKKNQQTFDNLCQPSKVMQIKNVLDTKKSTEKIKSFFKPQVSPQSKKTFQNVQQSKSAIILTQKSQIKQQNRNQSPTFVRSRKSISQLEVSKALKYNTRKQSTDKQNDLSIYSRGMNFRKKSQQKLLKMKEQEIMGEIKSCTFKPKLNPREKFQKSKILSTNAYGKLI